MSKDAAAALPRKQGAGRGDLGATSHAVRFQAVIATDETRVALAKLTALFDPGPRR